MTMIAAIPATGRMAFQLTAPDQTRTFTYSLLNVRV